MAIYHLHARFVKRSEGRSSVAAAAYRAGEKLRDDYTGQLHDFRHKADRVEHTELMLPEHLRDHIAERAGLWNAVEAQLGRKDGQPAFEVEVALPRELSKEQCRDLVRGFAQEQFVSKGLAVDLAIHRGIASDGGEHPHCHFLISTRRWLDDGKMGRSATDMQDSPAVLRKVYALEDAGKFDEALKVAKGTNLQRWRKAWEIAANDALADAGERARIDHRTLAAQKVAREPVPNIAHAFYNKARDVTGWLSRRVNAFWAAQFGRDMHRQFESMERERPDLLAEFTANANAYAKELTSGVRELQPAYTGDIEREREDGGYDR